ncbi:hypothetical protein K443DRAFT_9863 [Laccaria amethystina LaAM-08-1]|uniref:Uncharacterized protein n=1 Tax=Laccaria amethystina LaAM-08-1 TaxID=1095629 RepID=A0A0C9X853_9AGAR|nr:hypothetical protein K443DRAFT_9863 [Laccaria amethystina LaAM-08-1]
MTTNVVVPRRHERRGNQMTNDEVNSSFVIITRHHGEGRQPPTTILGRHATTAHANALKHGENDPQTTPTNPRPPHHTD